MTSPGVLEQQQANVATAPLVSVIIPHFNDAANLDRCLGLLMKQTFPSASFEVIVADNGSESGFGAVATLVGSRGRVISAETRGAGPARNAAVARARGAILAFIDSDCRPDRDWLSEGVLALDRYDVVGGAMRVEVDDPAHMSPTEAFEVVFAFRNANYIEAKGFTVTASMFVRRDVFDAVGPFRIGVSEDIDWCRRALRRGFNLGYAPKSVAGHPGRRTWPELKRKLDRQLTEAYALYRELPFGWLRWIGHSWLVLFSILPHFIYIFMTRKLRTMRDRMNAALILFRARWLRFIEAHRLAFSATQRD